MQDKYFYFIEFSLAFSYSRKQSQSLSHSILLIFSLRLATGFLNKVAKNIAVSIKFIL